MSSMIFSRLVVATHLQGRRGLCGDWRDLGVTGGVRLSQGFSIDLGLEGIWGWDIHVEFDVITYCFRNILGHV